jgi:hypothetical protein
MLFGRAGVSAARAELIHYTDLVARNYDVTLAAAFLAEPK